MNMNRRTVIRSVAFGLDAMSLPVWAQTRNQEGRATDGMVMVERDRGQMMPQTPPETAEIAETFLQTQGVGFPG